MTPTAAPTSVAVRLRTLRESAGLTAAALAARAGVHVRTINNIEQGRRAGTNCVTLMKLAAALGVGLGELVQ